MEKYKGRGIHNPKLLKSLQGGQLYKLLSVVNNYNKVNTDAETYLDVQLRNDYINIYYKGGRIIKINSENSAEFDEKYFLLQKTSPSLEDIKKQKLYLLEKFKTRSYEAYFNAAKSVMDKWFEENPNPERNEQHRLTTENKSGNYVIIDIEYQVSTLSQFCYAGHNKKSPRFDIIAVNREGQLCVIELKKGSGALKGSSGLCEHWDCYKMSIGRNPQPFIEEMKRVLSHKQEFGLIEKSVAIKDPVPVFMFAYAYDSETSQHEEFKKVYDTVGVSIPCIFLKDGSLKLSDL